MQNYRNNSMNYNNYRPMPVMTCAVETVKKDCLEDMPLAMAYVRKQSWRRIYKPDVAIARGTLFNELDKPFSGTGRGGQNCEK